MWGFVVDDLDAVTKFFLDLGFEREDLMPLEGEWMDKILASTASALSLS